MYILGRNNSLSSFYFISIHNPPYILIKLCFLLQVAAYVDAPTAEPIYERLQQLVAHTHMSLLIPLEWQHAIFELRDWLDEERSRRGEVPRDDLWYESVKRGTHSPTVYLFT